eukprot:CAMPEP_0198726906 /NCGR_PEP_ID=MMETSP1475-20131203/3811_1 /TAXON_ID= ORGANISM="Unidentified sp., Strain CCMP1999" /NCGR_SAMPLE_ID=MMETSP1475 /ASSEMBLY_ACC=CAM_ASM_001111 /LENGTH=209 /DNA_ID=CAMNT_0044488883 /DNA_START=122 /DNA_END=751 /DNA_ORIENTATION=-
MTESVARNPSVYAQISLVVEELSASELCADEEALWSQISHHEHLAVEFVLLRADDEHGDLSELSRVSCETSDMLGVSQLLAPDECVCAGGVSQVRLWSLYFSHVAVLLVELLVLVQARFPSKGHRAPHKAASEWLLLGVSPKVHLNVVLPVRFLAAALYWTLKEPLANHEWLHCFPLTALRVPVHFHAVPPLPENASTCSHGTVSFSVQ